MTTAIKRRRGTTTQHSTFTGLEGEITIDTTKDTAVVHDGATAGGRPLLREDLANNTEVVTKTGTQTLTNKTFTSPVINTPTGITKSDISLGNVDNTSDATKNAATATLTNKTITLGANTITGTVAQFQAAVTDGDFATLAGTETLTNKALNGTLGATTPSTIAGTTITSSALTSGRVTFASTGGLLADSANFLYNGTQVILGTTSALQSSQLTVYASPTPITTIDRTTNIGATVSCASSGTGYIQGGVRLGTEGNSGIYGYDDGASGAQGIGIFTGNNTAPAERMRIDSAGNVGIGRTPVNKLDIGTSFTSQSTTGINSSSKLIRIGNSEAGILFTTDINTAGSSSGTQTSSAQVGYVYFNSTFPTDFVIGTNTQTVASNLRFYNNNAEVMRIDSSGNLGIGTASPYTKLDVNGVITVEPIASGGKPQILLGSGGASYGQIQNDANGLWSLGYGGTSTALGTPVLKWDTSGNLGLGVTPSAWNTNVKAAQLASGSLYSYSTVDLELTQNCYYNTSNQWIYSTTAQAERYSMYNGQHQWWIAPSGTAGNTISFTQAMTLDASGVLNVGTTTIGGVGGFSIRPLGTYCRLYLNSNGTNDVFDFAQNGTQVGRIQIATTQTFYVTTSDYRLKENIAPMVGALEKVALLKPVTYKWKLDGSDGQGFIAHELAEVIPNSVAGEKDATEEQEYEISPAIPAVLDEEGNEVTPAVEAVMGTRTVPVYQGIDTSFLVATLTAAIQEQQAMIDELKAKVAALEAA